MPRAFRVPQGTSPVPSSWSSGGLSSPASRGAARISSHSAVRATRSYVVSGQPGSSSRSAPAKTPPPYSWTSRLQSAGRVTPNASSTAAYFTARLPPGGG